MPAPAKSYQIAAVNMNSSNGAAITRDHPALARVLTREAVAFLEKLHRRFDSTRQALLAQRKRRQAELDAGARLDFLDETGSIRGGDWKVAPTPADLLDRRVEITGPCDRKMMINALNSGARVFMADCEDAQSPTWSNQVQGQVNLIDAVRRTMTFTNPNGKHYTLQDDLATLLVRPRGWHLPENHLLVDGEPISGSLFDFGLYVFHNAHELLARDSGPYFYLAKLESYLEARLWNDVFNWAQDELGVPRGSIRATVLIETIHAAYQMEEILYELREHSAGLNAGRWDYIFSCIKTHRNRNDVVFPDRSQITMEVPFMHAYTELLVQSCHRHGAHAIGGMAAFIPNRRDPEVTEQALVRVRQDKRREANQGFDGTWVAHPDLVREAMEEFDRVLNGAPHQKHRLREDVRGSAAALRTFSVPGGHISEAGVRINVSVGLQYLNAWLLGNGAAAINNLMEDTATAEISRAQLWQWVHRGARLDDGRAVTPDLYHRIQREELDRLGADTGRLRDAATIMEKLIISEEFVPFLTLPAYAYIEG